MQRSATKTIFTLLFLSATATVANAVDLPKPEHYVEDYANAINASHERSLNGILQELEQKTGAQYIVFNSPDHRRSAHRAVRSRACGEMEARPKG